ncbi:hypothetical protein [Pseudomonas sp. 13B_3.2_Bac1]|uniref:hypothetical protein n=1 Tax=Pseudomonas sp. 13B_3.2_Bac1 TaxID=2971623 RepID=UPI0021C91722|nr:hypothetical protein [Pseudomonas sp. 13B_3.2_Bac1]MCU1772602.1 hypothetical protein [Pseudomonas sp. 13B_3.2_Bac1]
MSVILFPDSINNTILCSADPMNGVKVKVRLLPGTQIGAVLKLDWQGCSDPAGQQPIPGTETSLNHFVTEADISNGVDETIGQWLTHIKPIKHGSARVTCTINGGGETNAVVRVILVNFDGQFCDEV